MIRGFLILLGYFKLVMPKSRQIRAYLFVGIISALTNYLFAGFLYLNINFSIVVSSLFGFALSWLVAYFLSYYYTFKSNASHLKVSFKYFIITSIGATINILCMYLGVEHIKLGYTLSFLIMSVIVFSNNYYFNSKWTFR